MSEETSMQKQNQKLSTYKALFTAFPCGEPLAEALSRGRITDGEGQSAQGVAVAGCRDRKVQSPLQAPVTAARLASTLDVASA